MSSSAKRTGWRAGIAACLQVPNFLAPDLLVPILLASTLVGQSRATPTAIPQTTSTSFAVASPGSAEPQLHAAIAASEHRKNVPAIAWLCTEFLPTLPQWPAGLDPSAAFSLSLSATGLQIRKTAVVVPTGAVAIGTCSFSKASDAPQLVWRCDTNGREQWFVPKDFELPVRWQQLLHAIEADLIGTSRTLAVPVLTGHLAGGLLDNDPRSALLRLGPSLCGDATWHARREGEQLRVCGRSDGGLMLPVTYLALAIADGAGGLSALSLRAFAARDADQAEAARQLGRTDRELDSRTLRALLHAEDEVRLTAIEALVRHGASNELPAIIRAADAQHPWATIAARDAVTRLWPVATAEERHATRSALQTSEASMLQQLDVDGLATAPPIAEPPAAQVAIAVDGGRARALLLLLCTSIGLLGLWRRERALLHATAN